MAYTPQAIQFSETPTRILLSLAQQSRQEQLLRQRARMEDEKIRNSLPMEFVDKVSGAESDVKSLYGKLYLNDLYTKIKNKSIPTSEAQALAAQYAMDINSKSSAVKNFTKQADDALNAISNSFGIDKQRVKAQYGAYVYNNIADPSKLGNGAEYVGMIVDTHPELFVDSRNGQELFNKMIKEAPTADLTHTVKRDVNGNKMLTEISGGKIPFYMKMQESVGSTGLPVAKPVVDKDANGVIPDSIFNWFYNYGEGEKDFRMKTWIDAGANKMIIQNNANKKEDDPGYADPADDATKTIYKRKFVTDMLEQMKKYEAPTVSTVDAAKPKEDGAGAGEKKDEVTLDALKAINDKVEKDITAKTQYTQINTLPGIGRDAVLKIARNATGMTSIGVGDIYLKKGSDGNIGIYAAKDITSPSDPEDVKSAKGSLLSYVDIVANIQANQPLGAKAKKKVVEEAGKKKKVWNPQTGKFE